MKEAGDLVLAHLSDPHLPLPVPRLRELAGKRLAGCLNWYRRRRAIHLPAQLAGLCADIRRRAPDHILVTGDICNLSLPEEFRNGRRFLDSLGTPEQVSAVPGNHDAYVPVSRAAGLAHWQPFLDGDLGRPGASGRRRGAMALFLLNSGRPAPWHEATGEVSDEELALLEQGLARASQDGLFRIVAVHHPPLEIPGARGRKRLCNSGRLLALLRDSGAELVLHGHTHRFSLHAIPAHRGRTCVIGAPSASMPVTGAVAGGWTSLSLTTGENRWHLLVHLHRGGGTRDLAFRLAWPRP